MTLTFAGLTTRKRDGRLICLSVPEGRTLLRRLVGHTLPPAVRVVAWPV